MKKLFLLVSILSTFTASAQNKSFKVEKSGKGTPVLFLPGFTCPGDVWNETVKQLGDKYTIYKFTYAGFGGTTPIEFPWYSSIKKDLVQYVKENKLKKMIIIGHSMGGTLAVDVAKEFDKKVDKLVLVDALPCMREVMMPNVKAEDIVFDNPYSNNLLKMDAKAFGQTASFMAQNMTNQKEKVSQIAQWIQDSDRKTYVYGYTELLKIDLRDKMENIKAKTLILAADFPNKETVSQVMEKQYKGLKDKEVKVATNSKHFIMFDQKEWFYKELKNFLN